MTFKEEVAKLEAKVANTEVEHSSKIPNDVFSDEAQKEIEILARGLGMPQAIPTDYMFEIVKTKRGTTFLGAPTIVGKDDFLTVKWHMHEFRFVKDEAYDYDLEVKEDGNPVIVLTVTYVDEATEKEISYGFRFRLQPDVSLPTAGVLKRQFKTNPHSLAKYCRNDAPINSLKDAPDSFTITAVRTIESSEGKTICVLDTDFGSYWGNDACARLETPARAVVEGQEVQIEQPSGIVAISFSSYGKLRDLEIGEYKVIDFRRSFSDAYGEQVQIKLEDGKLYNANSAITKVINAFDPVITPDLPALLKVQDKRPMSNGNIKVICQFLLGEQENDDFDKSFNSWMKGQQETALPF